MSQSNRSFRLPHTLVLVQALVGMMLVLSWLVPSGEFQRVARAGRMVTVPGSFHYVPKVYLGLQTLLLAPIQGFVNGALLISFLLVIGGAFAILQETGAIEFGIRKLTRAMSGRPTLEWLLIPVLMTVFSLAGSVFGMSEEVIPFVIIFVPLARRLGYDSLVGVAIPFLGSAAGFAAAFFNPFTVGVAQKVAELPPNSGIGYRVFSWVLGTAVMITFVMVYAGRVKRQPELSPMFERDCTRDQAELLGEASPLAGQRHGVTLALFGVALGCMVWGILRHQWDIDAIAALFLGMGAVLGLVAGLRPSHMAQIFVAGAKDMVSVVLIVACARALLVIATDARILDSILYFGSSALAALPRALAAQMMFLIQAGINFFIHSGTAQAALTMPIMAPMAEMVGLTRQTSVFAFQLCEFVNPILPTSAVTMGVLGAAKIPYEIWAKWLLPLMGLLFLLSFLLLVPPVLLFYWGPF